MTSSSPTNTDWPTGDRNIHAELDHIVIAAKDLHQGSDYIEMLLGTGTVPGGQHKTEGTHNQLVRLGKDQYLEIISIDPQAPKPDHPRWFELDKPAMQDTIKDAPKLVTWAVRVTDIERAARIPLYSQCTVQTLSRGELRWKIALTPDGQLLEDGSLPLLIQWQVERTPAQRLPDSGCRIDQITIQHPDPGIIEKTLSNLGLVPPVLVQKGRRIRVSVDLDTPNAEVELCS